MPNKLQKGTRSLFTKLFVRPYEPVQVYGSVHNLARVGGVSILNIPKKYAPCELVIPTRFAATGQFLVDAAGSDIPGLFRIPGQTRTITALREHFVSHMYLEHDAAPRESDIEVTVRIACLPSQSALPYNVHDIASTFKFFLNELEGGILGSVEVFESLRKALLPIVKPCYSELDFQCCGLEDQEDDTVNARWVARVLCSIECAQRRNLILAVFGLLALLKRDPCKSLRDSVMNYSPLRERFPVTLIEALQDSCPQSNPTNERMSSKALGLVFAPLLLAHLTDSIRIEPLQRTSNAVPRRRSLLGSPRRESTVYNNVSTIHPQRASTTSVQLDSLSSPSPKTYEMSADRVKKKSSKHDAAQAKELGEGVERHKIAARMIEIALKNWEDIVDCLRENGFGKGEIR